MGEQEDCPKVAKTPIERIRNALERVSGLRDDAVFKAVDELLVGDVRLLVKLFDASEQYDSSRAVWGATRLGDARYDERWGRVCTERAGYVSAKKLLAEGRTG